MEFTKETFYNVAIGEVFKADGALWVCLSLDEFWEKYPSICIAKESDSYYRIGEHKFFDRDDIVEVIKYNSLKYILEEG